MLLNKYKELSYPVNLWSAVFQREVTADELPVDWDKALEYALETLPDNKKKEVLIYCFRDGMTWKEIGDIYGTSGEPIRQHANKALRMLRHPSRSVYLLQGLKEEKAIERTEKMMNSQNSAERS